MDPARQRAANTFGSQVRRCREARGWTIETLAGRCGMHFTYVSAIERGVNSITLYNAARLAAGLEMELAELVEGLALL